MCKDNFYNGNNPYGVQECWNFKTAKVEKRLRIPVDLRPPYTHIKPERTLSCWHGNRVIGVKPEALREDGYWKF